MRTDLNWYMAGTIAEGLPQLVTPDSPLRLEKEYDNFYILCPKDPVLDFSLVYVGLDSELMSANLHIETQKALDFQAGSNLSYDKCALNPEKIAALGKIMEHIVANNIPVYITATSETGEEILISGCNPITNKGIFNSNFKHTLTDLLE